MMHVFQFKGFSGFLKLTMGMLMLMLLLLALPSIFMMALWNAVVFETFSGPEITTSQGFILWAITLIVVQLTLKPQIQLQFQQLSEGKDKLDSPLKKDDHQSK